MAQHGYLREYDEGWDRDDDRERGWQDREDNDRDRMERDREWRGSEHNRSFMIGDRGRGYGRSAWEDNRDWPQRHRGYSSSPDDHYRSWRDKQMQALDRDYDDYCREREQQFHRDFDDWRSQRSGNTEPLQAGMTQSGLSSDPTGMTQAAMDTAPGAPNEEDPMATATVGTTSGARGRK